MVFRRGKELPKHDAPKARAGVVDQDPALDLVADLLRGLGEHVVPLGELDPDAIRERFDVWARHLLLGTPAPEQPDTGGSIPLPERSWSDARRYALDHHHQEYLLVRRSLGDLRDAIWAFINGMGEALADDRASDEALKEQMARVRHAVDSPTTEDIRREAIAAVGVMGRVIADRQRQQRRHFESIGEHVRQLRRELDSARARMERDGLTGAYNRAALDQHLKRVTDLGNLFGHGACLLMLDVDHFKWTNDSYGHGAGDEVLRKLSAALQATLRRKEDFLARYGGDEMVVVVAEDAVEKGQVLAERMLHAVRGIELRQGGESVKVTASIGVAALGPGESAAAWLERADKALYEAKEAGRDRSAVAPPPRRKAR